MKIERGKEISFFGFENTLGEKEKISFFGFENTLGEGNIETEEIKTGTIKEVIVRYSSGMDCY